MSLNTLLDRLALTNAEISTSPLLTAYRLPPGELDPLKFPMIYTIPLGFVTSRSGGGTVDRLYNFTLELLYNPLSEDTITTANISDGLTGVATFITFVETYYDNNPYLAVTGQAQVLGLQGVVLTQNDNSNLPLTGHDGEPYIGTQFRLAVSILIEKPTAIRR